MQKVLLVWNSAYHQILKVFMYFLLVNTKIIGCVQLVTDVIFVAKQCLLRSQTNNKYFHQKLSKSNEIFSQLFFNQFASTLV